MLDLRTLSTSRCTLEPLVVKHAPEMFHVLSDPAIYEFENQPPQSEGWRRLGFSPAGQPQAAEFGAEPDESVMIKTVSVPQDAA